MAGISKDDLLFHHTHGLCRVSEIVVSHETKEFVYSLLPIARSHAKIRYVIAERAMESSGFNKLISNMECLAILQYFRTGQSNFPAGARAWEFARLISVESISKETVKDIRRRQRMHEAVRGLAAELAYVLKLTSKEIAGRIQRSLGREADINPLVLNALAAVGKELTDRQR